MILTLVSESTVEPVTVAEAKTFLRMESTDSTAEDTLIGQFITVARRQAENLTKRALVSQTRQVIFDNFSNTTQAIELPRPPLTTISSNITITYVEDTTAGNTTTIPATAYTVDSDSEPGRIYPSYNNEWPTDIRDQHKAVTIQYVSGYSTAAIPLPILDWIKMRVTDLYENRQGLVEQPVSRIPRNYLDGLLDEYTILSVP